MKTLDLLGLNKISNIEEALKSAFGDEKASLITSNWEKLSNESDLPDYSGMQNALYEYLHSDYELSMIVSRYTDASIINDFCAWLDMHKSFFGKEILDVGCGTGIISCALAAMLPNAHITAIDRSGNSIKIAEQIKEKLKATNIDFFNASLNDYAGRTFDTVLSIRTFHENIPVRSTSIRYYPFSKQVSTYEQIYEKYCKELSSKVSEKGRLVCIERNRMDTELYSILHLFNKFGFSVVPKSLSELRCDESDFKEKSVFQTFILEKDNKEQDTFDIWSKLAFADTKAPENFTRSQADWFIEENGGDVLGGFETFSPDGIQLGKNALYSIKSDPDHFLLYQANYGAAGIQVLPMDILEDVKSSFKDRKIIDQARGFVVKDLF